MENIETTAEQPQEPKLIVTEEMRSYIYDIAKWTNFLAIVGFFFTGIMVVGAFTVGAAIGTNPQMAAMVGQMGAMGSVVFTVFCLIYAFAIFYPSLLMFKYSTKAKLGVLYGEQASLNEAMGKLKSLFKYWGILMVVFISLYVFFIVSTIMNGAMA